MKARNFQIGRRVLAAAMALVLTLGASIPAAGAQEIAPTCDETYYAILDYYGALTESSVVKSIRTYGNAVLTDYGTYDEVTNLTDGREATISGGRVTFDLSGDVPDKFYFEGKTTQPYTDFPWTLSMSYALNGVPTPAEELAGQSGLVEITLDALPNLNASEYSRNNLVLTAMSLFNGDDILSLDAPGAQVQLVGNLYCVLYMVMPGEEQHFTIRVGSEDFSYTGMIFLAVPATLQQLEQIADLREAKEKTEDSYHAIQDSMDVILDTLSGMSGSLSATASGLDRLNQARGTISGGKGAVYDSLDAALDSMDALTESIAPMIEHLSTTQQALTETTALLNEMSANVTSLKPEVENTRKILKALQSDLDELVELADDLDNYPTRAKRIAKNLSDDFSSLGTNLNNLRSSLNGLRSNLSSLQTKTSQLGSSDKTYVVSNDTDVRVIQESLNDAKTLRESYEASESKDDVSFQDYITGYLTGTGADAATAAGQAASLAGLWSQAQEEGFEEQLDQAVWISDKLTDYDVTVDQFTSTVTGVTSTGSTLTNRLASLCASLGSSGLSGSLEDLSDLMEDMAEELDDHGWALSAALDTLSDAAALGLRVSDNVDTALDQTQSLTNIMNTYEPKAQQALEDAKTFTSSTSVSITSLTNAARAAEELMKNSGSDLDAGTQQTLSGLSAALRQSVTGLSQTDVIRNAKDTIDALITDEWESHTGGENNILLMDAAAKPISLTDSRNEGVTSIQYIMRSQEIKVDDGEADDAAEAANADNGTVWSRIVDMFKDIWHTIISLFIKDTDA